jgi:hypothetical protein
MVERDSVEPLRSMMLLVFFVFLPLKIAQRFNAGFQMTKNPKSLQGRQDRAGWMVLLSSLKGLEYLIA